VTATPEAIDLVERLVEIHGPVAFVQLGECEDGAAATCLTRGELLPSSEDVKLGEVAGAPFYMDAHLYERAGRPTCQVDVAPGPAGGLALEGLEQMHFVVRSSEPAASGHLP
jgi:uncharacterized protein (DUF779 family)